MIIHFDGSASAGSDAWPEIDSRLPEDGAARRSCLDALRPAYSP